MPPKKKATKQPSIKSKATAKASVKQVVNVKIGSDKQTRRRARVPTKLSPTPSPLLRQAPPINLSLSTQSYNQPQPSYLNEYNMLLRQMAEERTARARATPPLQPNTTPLTSNLQTNDLLSKKQISTGPKLPVMNIVDDVVDNQLYDDPLTNENMFVNSSRLAENLAPTLPISNFDYNDVNNYNEENLKEQEAVINQVEKEKKPKKNKKEKLLEETNNLIEFYNKETNDSINLVKRTASKKQIQAQNDRIKELIDSRALKVSQSKR